MEENSEVRRSNRRSQPHHRGQSQTRGIQISTAAAAASQRQCPTASNMFTMTTDIPGANLTCWTPPNQSEHPDCANRLLSFHISLATYAYN
nr:unnamed protein product [Spirometra erinaceieuropaei]